MAPSRIEQDEAGQAYDKRRMESDSPGDKRQMEPDSPRDKRKMKPDSPDAKRHKTKQHSACEEPAEASEAAEGAHTKSVDSPAQDEADAKKESDETPGDELDAPSSILEKGIVYFFVRGRVDTDELAQMRDIARTYMLLRPIAVHAKLGPGPLSDAGTARVLALPKKVLPGSARERFMAFVYMAGASYDEIRGSFLAAGEYTTKTVGTRHTPAATPVGEGVYAVTTTGRESHLSYVTTLPETLGPVQRQLGIRERGSFIVCTKNPEYAGPAGARLPRRPKFPKRIMHEFRSLRWLPARPAHLDYVDAQILLIGQSAGSDMAAEPRKEDQEAKEGEEAREVLQSLEDEDLKRMRHLPGRQSASIFADLHVQAKDYPRLQTTF